MTTKALVITSTEARERWTEVQLAVESGQRVVVTKMGRPLMVMAPWKGIVFQAEEQETEEAGREGVEEGENSQSPHHKSAGSQVPTSVEGSSGE